MPVLRAKGVWSSLIRMKMRLVQDDPLTGFPETLRPSASGFSPALLHSHAPCRVAWFIVELLLSQRSVSVNKRYLACVALECGGYLIRLETICTRSDKQALLGTLIMNFSGFEVWSRCSFVHPLLCGVVRRCTGLACAAGCIYSEDGE